MMSVSEHGFGRLHADDPRDARYLMSAVTPAEVTVATRYWWAPTPLDQGPHPHCVGYSWRQRLNAHPVYQRGGPSAPDIYHAAQLVDEWPGENYDGTSVRAGAKVLVSHGFVSSYVWAWDAETVRRFVLNEGTVIVGTVWTNGMTKAPGGILRPHEGPVIGGHAYLLVGYSHKRGAFRVLNSWGRQWSQNGRAWLLGEDLDYLLDREGEACAPTEKAIV